MDLIILGKWLAKANRIAKKAFQEQFSNSIYELKEGNDPEIQKVFGFCQKNKNRWINNLFDILSALK